jgi:hypothetical protein
MGELISTVVNCELYSVISWHEGVSQFTSRNVMSYQGVSQAVMEDRGLALHQQYAMIGVCSMP